MTTNITSRQALEKIKEISQAVISGKFKWDIPKGSNRISAIDIMTNYAKEIKDTATQALAPQECDVTKCESYTNNGKCRDSTQVGAFCCNNPNCYYKQLQLKDKSFTLEEVKRIIKHKKEYYNQRYKDIYKNIILNDLLAEFEKEVE